MRRRATPGTHGGAVGNRVSADAVGRRSFFLRACVAIATDTLLRARRKCDAGAHLRVPEGRGWDAAHCRYTYRGLRSRTRIRVPSRPRNLFSVPGLRGRLKVAESSTTVDRPRSVHFPQGASKQKSGGNRPLREMTSAAYTVGRDSVAEVTAECCQARFFLKRDVNREGCRGKIRSMARTV